jgi:V8-like Glu-specific endopeptidase
MGRVTRAALVFAVVAMTGTPTAMADTEPVRVDTVPVAEQAAALTYWTPERMQEVGNDANVPPERLAKPWVGAAPTGVGRFFFTEEPGGDSWCTATAVPSANRDTVVTAAHCVHPGFTRDDTEIKAKNIVFVPAYDHGKAPKGVFAARAFVVPTDYSLMPKDVAMVVLAPQHGKRVADAAGTQKIAFGTKPTGPANMFGYPGSTLAHGELLMRCTVTATLFDNGEGWQSPCDMAGGSSGGPWLADFDGRTGTIFSVVSRGGLDEDLHTTNLEGPAMGDAAKQAYVKAAAM